MCGILMIPITPVVILGGGAHLGSIKKKWELIYVSLEKDPQWMLSKK